MTRFLADENFDNDILRGVLRRNPQIDILRVQDIGLAGAEDPDVLDRAAEDDRVLLTHDVRTITALAYERVERGLKMPGVFEAAKDAALGQIISDILLIAEVSTDGEWEGQVRYLLLK